MRIVGRSFARLSALVFSLVLIASAVAQDAQTSPKPQPDPLVVFQSQQVLRSTTRLVVVDVVVTDEKGNFIPDLKAEDFIVNEDGKPQKISDFSVHHPGATAQAPAPLPANVTGNNPLYSSNSCMNVILLDAINTDFSNHAYAQDMLIKYLETGPPIQPTAVFALDGKLRMLHDFTTDTKALRDALAHFVPQGPQHIADVYAAASPFSRRGSFQVTGHGRQLTFQSFNYLARALAGYPGRKNLLWLSEGFPLNLFPEALMGEQVVAIEDYSPMVERIADALMDAQVALYPIDAAGVSKDDRFSARTAMESMAERTGGRTFYNRNDIDMGVRTSMDDGSSYYTLEYYPLNKDWNRKFRSIQVKVDRASTKLRYRQGYYALGPNSTAHTDATTAATDFSHAMDLDFPSSTSVRFLAEVTPPSAKTQNKLVVKFAIDPHTIAFEKQSDDLQHAAVSCVVWAYPGKGEPVRSEGGATAAVKADVYQQLIRSRFPCQRTMELKPGHYKLRLGVLDRATNLIGSTTTEVTIP
jgi:VWFA-related protein